MSQNEIKSALDTLAARARELQQQREEISARLGEVESEISVLQQAAKLISRYTGQLGTELPLMTASGTGVVYSSPHPPVREAIINALSSLGEGRISDIVRVAEGDRPGSINPKTAGNVLWVLKNEKQAERDGMVWRWIGDKEKPQPDKPEGAVLK